MSSGWIKIEKTLPTKPEVIALSRILKIDRFAVVGRLVVLWSWMDDISPNGNADSVTSQFIDETACTKGFANALQKVGWLVVEKGRLAFPRFEVHNGQTSKARALTARRANEFREKKRNALVTVDALPEKRREEISPLTPQRGEAPTRRSRRSEPPASVWGNGPIQFDSSKPGKLAWIGIRDDDLVRWREAYPAVDVGVELARAADWCIANPARGRKSNYASFLTRWFSRAQDQGGSGHTKESSHEPGRNLSRVRRDDDPYSARSKRLDNTPPAETNAIGEAAPAAPCPPGSTGRSCDPPRVACSLGGQVPVAGFPPRACRDRENLDRVGRSRCDTRDLSHGGAALRANAPGDAR